MSRDLQSNWLLPRGVDASAWPLLAARSLRAFADGYMALLLPAYLLAIGLGTLEVGIVSTATMLGSALATLAVGGWGHRVAGRRLLRGAALLMVATGVGFAGFASFWPLLVVAFVGTLNPSSGDVSVFLPLEHARLAHAAQGEARVALFARYSVFGAGFAALGALAAAAPDALVEIGGIARLDALRRCSSATRPSARGLRALSTAADEQRRSRRSDDRAARTVAQDRRPPRGAVQRRCVRRRPRRQLAALALAVRAIRAVARTGRRVLLLDRAAERGVAVRRAAGRASHRPAEHDGVHAHPGQRLPGRGRARAEPAARAGAAAASAARSRRWTCRRAPRT